MDLLDLASVSRRIGQALVLTFLAMWLIDSAWANDLLISVIQARADEIAEHTRNLLQPAIDQLGEPSPSLSAR